MIGVKYFNNLNRFGGIPCGVPLQRRNNCVVSVVERKRSEFLGKEFETNGYGKCVVIDYKSAKEVTVEFYEPSCIIVCESSKLKKGEIKNPMKPSYYNKGYIGVGKHGFKDFNAYRTWQSMLVRAYSESYHKDKPTYKDVEVCEEWLNFQNFAKWFYEQEFSEVKDDSGNKYHLDKDLLVRGNKVYSPETCCFIPHEINALFTRDSRLKGKFVGVNFRKSSNKFQARITCCGIDEHLGYFDRFEEAFKVFKTRKEGLIRDLAEKWKFGISKNVYEALLRFEIKLESSEVYYG